MAPPTLKVELTTIDRDIIRMALRGDIEMSRYLPEVMRVCSILDITEPPWMEDEVNRERVELNRPAFPNNKRSKS